MLRPESAPGMRKARCFPPTGVTTRLAPSRSPRQNASLEPSGDHTGVSSYSRLRGVSVTSPVPSAVITCTRGTSPATYAKREPSGDGTPRTFAGYSVSSVPSGRIEARLSVGRQKTSRLESASHPTGWPPAKSELLAEPSAAATESHTAPPSTTPNARSGALGAAITGTFEAIRGITTGTSGEPSRLTLASWTDCGPRCCGSRCSKATTPFDTHCGFASPGGGRYMPAPASPSMAAVATTATATRRART